MQRTLIELGYVPAAYLPALAFHQVERLDVVKMLRLMVPLDVGPLTLVSPADSLSRLVLRAFEQREVLPRLGEVVNRIDLLSGLTDEQKRRLAGTCTLTSFDAEQVVFEPGDICSEMYLILDGEAEIRLPGDPTPVGSVTVGECLGEVALLMAAATRQPRSPPARAAPRFSPKMLSTSWSASDRTSGSSCTATWREVWGRSCAGPTWLGPSTSQRTRHDGTDDGGRPAGSSRHPTSPLGTVLLGSSTRRGRKPRGIGCVGSRAQHMVTPMGWENRFGFVCAPTHRTYSNAKREGVFTVSYPRPDQVVLSALAASPRCDDDTKPILSGLPTCSGRSVDAPLLRDAYLCLECELERVIDDFGPTVSSSDVSSMPGRPRMPCGRAIAKIGRS